MPHTEKNTVAMRSGDDAAWMELALEQARMAASAGTGGHCAYCEKEIHPQSVEYEVEAFVGAGLRTLHFHRVCLHLWEALL